MIIALIDAPFFCAGVTIMEDRVIEAAPIIRYMLGWNTQQVKDYVRKRRWKIDLKEQ